MVLTTLAWKRLADKVLKVAVEAKDTPSVSVSEKKTNEQKNFYSKNRRSCSRTVKLEENERVRDAASTNGFTNLPK